MSTNTLMNVPIPFKASDAWLEMTLPENLDAKMVASLMWERVLKGNLGIVDKECHARSLYNVMIALDGVHYSSKLGQDTWLLEGFYRVDEPFGGEEVFRTRFTISSAGKVRFNPPEVNEGPMFEWGKGLKLDKLGLSPSGLLYDEIRGTFFRHLANLYRTVVPDLVYSEPPTVVEEPEEVVETEWSVLE